jgi:hypothetical protein
MEESTRDMNYLSSQETTIVNGLVCELKDSIIEYLDTYLDEWYSKLPQPVTENICILIEQFINSLFKNKLNFIKCKNVKPEDVSKLKTKSDDFISLNYEIFKTKKYFSIDTNTFKDSTDKKQHIFSICGINPHITFDLFKTGYGIDDPGQIHITYITVPSGSGGKHINLRNRLYDRGSTWNNLSYREKLHINQTSLEIFKLYIIILNKTFSKITGETTPLFDMEFLTNKYITDSPIPPTRNADLRYSYFVKRYLREDVVRIKPIEEKITATYDNVEINDKLIPKEKILIKRREVETTTELTVSSKNLEKRTVYIKFIGSAVQTDITKELNEGKFFVVKAENAYRKKYLKYKTKYLQLKTQML